MSLFVKGAKLPKIEGDKSIKAEIRCVGGKWEFGIMTGGYYCCQQWSFYPLSELPPHGKLGDLDESDNYAYDVLEICSAGGYKSQWEAAREMQKVYRDAPSIIEAEEG